MIPENYGHLYPPFHARRIEIGAVQDQPFHKGRIFQGEEQGDVTAVGKPKDMGFFDALFRHEFVQILRKPFQRKGCISPGRLSVPPCIHGDHTVFRSEKSDLMLKIRAVFTVAVEQDQRKPLSRLGIVQLYIHKTSAQKKRAVPKERYVPLTDANTRCYFSSSQ